MSLNITAKQKKFAQCIVNGMSTKDAYFAAYDTNTTDNAAYTEGAKLLNNERVQEYIKTIQKPLIAKAASEAISEREKKRQFLWDMINNATNDSDKLRAMDILNKMDSEYINIQRIEKEDTPIQDLDTKELIKLTRIS